MLKRENIMDNIMKDGLDFKGTVLPFQVLKIQIYPDFTGIIGILYAHGRGNIWLLNNYILIWVLKGR